MMDTLKWNFPLAQHTTEESSDKNNIDTFSDDKLGNLAREIIQNSIDARRNHSLPVKIVFETFKTPKDSFPGLHDYYCYLKKWFDIHKNESETNNKDLIFVKNILRILDSDEDLMWLRISDFNTTGLWGSSEVSNHNTPWFAFVHGSGKNSKQSSNSGGSKGVGKNAIFANSEFQTMFVQSRTINNESASTGVGLLVSSPDDTISENPDWTLGIGFCVEDNDLIKQNRPLPGLLNLDKSFSRSSDETGTDIFVPAFVYGDNWQKEIIGQTIFSFMPSILNGDLEVKTIDNNKRALIDAVLEIKRENLDTMISSKHTYKNAKQRDASRNIYNVLTSPNAVVYKNEKDGFELTLRIMQDDLNGDNHMYTYRCPTNMFIKSYKIQAYVTCSAVMMIEGKEIASRLRSVEDATHSKWSKEKYSKTNFTKEQIEEALNEVEGMKERCADNFGATDSEQSLDFDYMRENGWCSDKPEEEITREAERDSGLPSENVSFNIKNDPSKHKAKKRPLKKKNNIIDSEGDATNWVVTFGEENIGELESSHPIGHNSVSSEEPHGGSETNNVEERENGKISLVRKNVATASAKMASIDPRNGLFTLVFCPKSSGKNVVIEILKTGVGSSDVGLVNIKKAKQKQSILPLKVEKNKVFMKEIVRGTTYVIHLSIDISENYVWEVNISANE